MPDSILQLLAVLAGLFASFALTSRAAAQSVLFTVQGSASGQELGMAVAGGGDVNNDGFDDLVVADSANGSSVFVISGRTGQPLYSFLGNIWTSYYRSPAIVGNVFADGYSAFAAIHELPPSPAVALVSSMGGGAYSFAPTTVGVSIDNVAAAGDINNDGFADILLSESMANLAYVRSGRDGTILWQAKSMGQSDWLYFGEQVSGLGDVDHDGFADFTVVSRDTQSPNEYVRAFSGRTGLSLYVFTEPLNCRVAGAGDVNSDGFDDIIVGAGGFAFVYSGRDGSVLYQKSDGGNPSFGASVAGVRDVNQDGFADFVVGEPATGGGSNAGRVWVFSGADGSSLMIVDGVASGNFLGESVAMAGDANGDGFPDFVAGAPYAANGLLTAAGSIEVVSGSAYPPVSYCTAKPNSLGCDAAAYATGMASTSGADDFHIKAKHVLSKKTGILAWSFAPSAVPFAGGTLCVQSPIKRTDSQFSGGNPPPTDCSGTFDFFFSQSYMQVQGVSAGDTIYAQYWYRDPGFSIPYNVGLSDAVRFTVGF